MISVKGTQTGSESTDPAATYALKPKERSGTVAKVSLLMISVVLYLKAFLSGPAEAAEEASTEESSDGAASGLKVLVIAGGKQRQDLNGKESDGTSASPSTPASFGFTPGADTIAYANAERQVVSPVFQPAGYVAAQANENGPPGEAWDCGHRLRRLARRERAARRPQARCRTMVLWHPICLRQSTRGLGIRLATTTAETIATRPATTAHRA